MPLPPSFIQSFMALEACSHPTPIRHKQWGKVVAPAYNLKEEAIQQIFNIIDK